jgi:hypothetical protein
MLLAPHACARRTGPSYRKQQRYQAKFRADSGSNLHLQHHNRGYALSEGGELIAIITYRKGAVRVAQLLAQAWPQRFGPREGTCKQFTAIAALDRA